MPTSFNLDISLKEKMDCIEADLAKEPQVYLPLCHRFTPGLYIREIFMPAGTIVTSRTHKVTHPYVISQGKFKVITQDGKGEIIEAPYTGVTEAGTRRIIQILEDTVWTAFYVTEKTDIDEIGEDFTFTENEKLPEGFRQAYLGNARDILMP